MLKNSLVYWTVGPTQ